MSDFKCFKNENENLGWRAKPDGWGERKAAMNWTALEWKDGKKSRSGFGSGSIGRSAIKLRHFGRHKKSFLCVLTVRHQFEGAEHGHGHKKSCHVIVGIVKMLSAIITSHDFGWGEAGWHGEQKFRGWGGVASANGAQLMTGWGVSSCPGVLDGMAVAPNDDIVAKTKYRMFRRALNSNIQYWAGY